MLSGRSRSLSSFPAATSRYSGFRDVSDPKRCWSFSVSQLGFRKQPVIAVVTVLTTSLFVQFKRSPLDFVLGRDCPFSRLTTAYMKSDSLHRVRFLYRCPES